MIRPAAPRGHKWADLQETANEIPIEERRYDAAIARVHATPDGAKMFEFMHRLATFRRNAPNDSDGALRELEAQRRFVAILEARIARHNSLPIDKAETIDGGRNGSRRRRRRNPPG